MEVCPGKDSNKGLPEENMCVNQRHPRGTVRSQGLAIKAVEDFKYLGSTVQSNGEREKEVTRFSESKADGRIGRFEEGQ